MGSAGSWRSTSKRPMPTISKAVELVLADAAYQNACQNSDKDLALLEGGEAVKRPYH